MKTQIIGKGIDISSSLREHIDQAISQMIEKYFDHSVSYHANLEKHSGVVEVSLEIWLGTGLPVRAQAEHEDIYMSVDKAIRKAEQNLRRYKKRIQTHYRTHDHSKELKGMQYVLNSSYRNLEEKEESDAHGHKQASVIAETTAYIPTISVSDAVMRLDIGGNSALLFRNKSHGELNMVYLRKDGNIGWIDPKGYEKN